MNSNSSFYTILANKTFFIERLFDSENKPVLNLTFIFVVILEF